MKKCKKYILRKSLLYRTKVEYADYTINHVEGCAHGCKYPCYAYLLAKRFGKVKDYNDWTNPKLVKNIDQILDREIPKYKKKIKSVHLCFTTDPFMNNYSDIINSSVHIIKKLNQNGIVCSALTKGKIPYLKLEDTSKKNMFGITLISLNENYRENFEPGSAKYVDRINSLKEMKKMGFKTWASIEPYPTPNIFKQDIEPILGSINFVDKIIFGRLNYNKKTSEYKDCKQFYNQMAQKVINFCKQHNIEYHIKTGTITKTQ